MKERNYGIDCLRIVSLFYVIVLHVLGQGGVIHHCIPGTGQYYAAWLLEIAAFCAVDCFALISGYVGFRSDNTKIKLSNYVRIWFQVVFYGLLITFIFKLSGSAEISIKTFIKEFLPVTYNKYWYFTAYTGLFFIAPFINAAVDKTDDSTLKKQTLQCFILFSVFSTVWRIFSEDSFQLTEGYSFVWIAFLYFLGAVIKKTDLFSTWKTGKCMILYFCLVLFTFLWNQSRLTAVTLFGYDALPDLFISYISPTILMIAIIHLILFARLQISAFMIRLVRFAAPGAFSVYIINCHYFVWNYLMADRFVFICNSSILTLIAVVFGFSAAFVFAYVTLDYLRQIILRF